MKPAADVSFPVRGTRAPERDQLNPALRILVDRAEVLDVNTRYAFAVDRRDWEQLAACFAPDVETSGWGRAEGTGREPLVEFIKGVAHFHTTMHMMGNHFVRVEGDRAETDCYAMLTHHYDVADEPKQMNATGGRYVDRLERVDGAWRIHTRGGEPEWTVDDLGGLDCPDAVTRALVDRAQIHDLLMTYASGLDLREFDRVSRCFSGSFEARYGDHVFSDHRSLIEFVRGVEFFDSTSHFLADPLIEVRGDEAWALTYAMINHQPGDWLSAGPTYRDHLVREDGRWSIVERGLSLPDLAGAADLPDPRPLPAASRWLVDRELIRHTTTQWNLAIDTGDVDAALACLAPDFTITLAPSGPLLSDLSAVEDALTSGSQPGRTCHWPGNQLVDLGAEEAHVETYVYRSERRSAEEGFTGWPDGALRLVDRMVRVGERWRIADRRVVTNRVK